MHDIMLKKQSVTYSLLRHTCKKMRIGRDARTVRGRITFMVHSYYRIVFMFLQFRCSTRKRYCPLKYNHALAVVFEISRFVLPKYGREITLKLPRPYHELLFMSYAQPSNECMKKF